ncbi:MAG TPA: HAD-IIIA family hydrolase [Thermoanaerobaculia bacterium]
MTRALFLDRDGVLDALVHYSSHDEWESPRSAADVRILPGVPDALRRAQAAGWLLFIITNQPSYAKGKVSLEGLHEAHEAVLRGIEVPVTKSYTCYHHPHAILEELKVACECRKPGTLFLRQAHEEFGVDLGQSWFVGDQDSDLRAGRAAGTRVALIESPGSEHKRGTVEPDVRFGSLAEFVAHVIEKRAP